MWAECILYCKKGVARHCRTIQGLGVLVHVVAVNLDVGYLAAAGSNPSQHKLLNPPPPPGKKNVTFSFRGIEATK